MRRITGRRRRLTDEQVRRIREWKPRSQLAAEIGISRRWFEIIRSGYEYKQPSP